MSASDHGPCPDGTHKFRPLNRELGTVHTDECTRCHAVRMPYLPIPPDAERDARVAARRAADARKAGRALSRLLGDFYTRTGGEVLPKAYGVGWDDGYRASEEQHNRHYGACYVVGEMCTTHDQHASRCAQHKSDSGVVGGEE